MSNTCFRHPENEGKYFCGKYNKYLCEDCLACQDPTLYCKFRKMCLIWEFVKYGTPDEQREAYSKKKAEGQKEFQEKQEPVKITFVPSNKIIEVQKYTTVLDAARDNEIYINARCNGKGVCGSCKVKVLEGKVEDSASTPLFTEDDKKKGYILGCTSKITGDVKIEIPDENSQRAMKIVEDGEKLKNTNELDFEIKSMASVVPLKIKEPSLDDPSSDLERIRLALKQKSIDYGEPCISLDALSELSTELRKNNWKVNITLLDRRFTKEIIRTSPFNDKEKIYGLAIDMGTTSVVAYLVDLITGDIVGATSTQNRQVVCGEDVISRIICAKDAKGLDKLHKFAITTVNGLIDELVTVSKVHHRDIVSVALAGNTVMTQSVLKLDPSSIRTEPYIPIAIQFPIWHAKEIGLNINPNAGLYIVPGNAAYVGGDITSGIVASGLNKSDKISLFIDIGTNGEMVLGNKDWMMTASCSAGPAFEGGGIRHGMRALPGAIDNITIDPLTHEPTFSVIDDLKPIGICGSGMISLLASLYLSGIIDSSSKFSSSDDKSERVRVGDFGKEYVIAWQKDTDLEEDIFITESDISILMQSKAAVYGGVMTLIKNAGLTINSVEQILVAGGFGKYIEFDQAITIGLLPDVDRNKFLYLGNSSIKGAYQALLSDVKRKELDQTSKAMTYVDFSSSNLFYDEYKQAMFLPHTEERDFPTVLKKKQSIVP